MGKYIGIIVVLFIGIAAIGITSYQANAFRQEALSRNARMDGLAAAFAATRKINKINILSAKTAATTTTSTPKTSAATSSTPSTPQTSTATSISSSTPSAKLQWGVFAGDQNDNLSLVEHMVGKQANIQAVFIAFNDPFPDYIGGLCPNKTMLVFWENTGVSLDSIIAGTYDSTIKNFSAGAQQYGCPVIISLFHEMNGNWDTWDGPVGSNSPAKIISAWQHVHDLVTATNVKWAWAINNVSVPDTASNQPGNYYPGDAYVDYVGVDGFNTGDPWASFADTFDSSVAFLENYHKPIYIFSMGAVADSRKAAWIADGLGVQVKKYKNFAGWVWFNQNGADGNWSFNSDPASLAAFIAALP